MAVADSNHTRSFRTTHWSVVRMIDSATEEQRRAALATLADIYWYPVYSYIRRDGNNHHDAEDLAQGFFEQVLEKENLGGADPTRAKFRTFLLTILKNFLVSEHRRRSAQKRGGGQRFVPFENADFEGRFSAEVSHDQSPESLYQRDWVSALLDRVLLELGEEYAAAGKTEIFNALKSNIAETKRGARDEISKDLGMSNAAIAVALHRMRTRFRSLLQQAVKKTLHKDATTEEIDFEIRLLLGSSEN